MRGLDRLKPMLDLICPMHLVLDARGTIRNAGATLHKICGANDLQDADFFDLFVIARPTGLFDVPQLLAATGRKLHLSLRAHPGRLLKGVVAPFETGAVVNLSFGISILEAVRAHALTSADFAATDMTVEMLYLVEAKSAAMEASRKLNQRLQGAKVAAEEQAVTDTLTGLRNRRALDLALLRLAAADADYALMHVDLDYFKAVNDTLGHAAGDHVLRHVAQVLTEETRKNDTVARVGGDEFVLVLPGLTDVAALNRIAQRIIARLEVPTVFGDAQCHISCSIGTRLCHAGSGVDPQQAMTEADVALYASKREGRARHTVFDVSGEAAGTSVPRLRSR